MLASPMQTIIVECHLTRSTGLSLGYSLTGHLGYSLRRRSGTLFNLTVEALLKGKTGTSVQVFSPNDSGRLPLPIGTRYLLFLSNRGGRLTMNASGNSAKLASPFR